MRLTDLPEDIILAILANCDVVTVSIFEQTCKYCKTLALSRLLWLSFIEDLDYDHAPNLLPHESIQALSTERLREVVYRSYRGFVNWTSPRGPKPIRSVTMVPPGQDKLLDYSDFFHMLIAGGRYYIFQNGDGRFYCHDTQLRLNVCSHYRPSYTGEVMKSMDCIVVDGGGFIILGFVVFRKSDQRELFIIVRFDLKEGTSDTVGSYMFPQIVDGIYEQMIFLSERSRVKVHNNMAVAWTPGCLLVVKWRTGDKTTIKEHGDVHSLDIVQDHILCIVRPLSGGIVCAAAPLSLIFSGVGPALSSESVSSEDVFVHVAQLAIPDVNGRTVLPEVDLLSICTSSWKCPHRCEFDAPAVPTRILVTLRLFFGPEIYYMIFELEFAPADTSPDPPTSSESEYILICQRHSSLFSYDSDFPETIHLTSASRTGRAIGSFVKINNPVSNRSSRNSYFLEESTITPMVYAIDMHTVLGPAGVEYGPDTDTQNELVVHGVRYPKISSDLFSENDEDTLIRLNVEEYSGALWYRRGNTVTIHYFD